MHVLANISRSRYNTPSVWTKWNCARSRRVHVIAGEGVLAGMRSVRVRHACGGPGGLPLGSAFPLCCHSDATRAPIANPPNSAQLGDSPYHSPKLHPGPCNSVGMRPRTDRQTDRQTRVTTIHFSWSIRLRRNVIMIRRQACLVTTYTHR